ncbi:MAG: UDP-galactopyranose mutase [Propionibacteriaceae bacterium]|jgi:UDP-galactopyranose mutase|nr:UDP-galactopyranose mutase [Propionibacteriaceae bacterium]
MSLEWDALIVGSGLSGATIARVLAERYGFRVLVVERRGVVGGNVYDEYDESGVFVQRYGPHAFHTDNLQACDFITRFSVWTPWELTSFADLGGGVRCPVPFGLSTIDHVYSSMAARNLRERLRSEFGATPAVPVRLLLSSADPWVTAFGRTLVELDYRPYTSKQWNMSPESLDVSVFDRVQVSLDGELRYFRDAWQLMPVTGFGSVVTEMLRHPLISVRTSTDARSVIRVSDTAVLHANGDSSELGLPVVYTGPIDELLDYRFGRLPWRSLTFEYQTRDRANGEPAPVVAYPLAEGFTRITDFGQFPYQHRTTERTTVAVEYPHSVDESTNLEPYYPVPSEESRAQYERYAAAVRRVNGLFLAGRLADYRYYNMDQAVQHALEVAEKIGSMYVR